MRQLRIRSLRGHQQLEQPRERGAETSVNFNATTRAGNQLLWTSPTLSPGTHTFRLRVVGPNIVVPDRVDIVS